MIYILSILTEHKVYKLDTNFIYFSYREVLVGSRVNIDFNHQKLVGFILNVEICDDLNKKEEELGYKIKEIDEIIDDKPIINENLLKLAYKLKERYIYPLIGVLNTMLPPSLKSSSSYLNNPKINYITYYELINKSYYPKNKYEERILNKFNNNSLVLKNEFNDSNTLDSLLNNNIIKETKLEKYRFNLEKIFDYPKEITLSKEQENVFNTIKAMNENLFLLKGITGSGKTIIYLKLIEDALKENKTSLILVPEIALTPLMVSQILSKFNNEKVAILHSSLTRSERYDEYRKIRDDKVKIVIGTRSAIFAPLKNLKYIIIDEEHDPSYKQEMDLTYDAKDVAILRSNIEKCKVIFGSATPSIEMMARSKNSDIKLLELNNKYFNKEKNDITLVDFKNKNVFSHSKIFSDILITKINRCLNENKQVMLMINKRGYSSSLTCEECGFIYKCPSCNIPLIYHKDNDSLMCHHCDYKIKFIHKCPICRNTKNFKYGSLGIEQVIEEFERLFPNINYGILDSDKTPTLSQIEEVLTSFNLKKINVIIGTQILAKGHDFKDVSLVGIISADTLLNISSFKANEYTFSLLTQTLGRMGRFYKGEGVIQTYNINNKTINYAINEDYDSFYNYEINNRKKYMNPPFIKLISLRICSLNINSLKNGTFNIVKYLKQVLKEERIESSFIQTKYKNYYSYEIFIKTKNYSNTKVILNKLIKRYQDNKLIRIYLNISPLNL